MLVGPEGAVIPISVGIVGVKKFVTHGSNCSDRIAAVAGQRGWFC